MSLSAGHKLGPYEIQALIGEGGMGEVYRARDTRLGREVAVKVSHERFTERFDREARTISSLNHPNICALYDVGPDYLVMEYVDGDSPRGPMLLDEALAIAMQIAEALREAHDKGIVHRDLKPANIKITAGGTVKVLDFGLAKALEGSGGSGWSGGSGGVAGASRPGSPGRPDSPDLSASPTMTSPAMTHAGMILGTAAYMAPEQARGKPVDTRADIWAFGVVLYELLTGERPFRGDDLAETLASVVKDPPNLNAVPARVRRLLEVCLQKDPKKRLQSIGDVGLLLGDDATAAPVAARRGFAPAVTFGAAALALVATLGFAALGLVHFREAPPVERSLRLSIPIPGGGSVGWVELSPDGKRLLLRVTPPEGEEAPRIYVRSLEAYDLQPLAGTDAARSPFWSADGSFIGFFANNSLKVIPAIGGPVRVLCGETGLGLGGAWNRDGVILFASESGVLRRVDATDGECRTLDKADPAVFASSPLFLPNGDHFFYVRGRPSDPAPGGVYLATLEEPTGRRVLDDVSAVLFAPKPQHGGHAHLLFLRDGTLMAQRFDEASLQLVGDPFAVVSRASFALTRPQLAASASPAGTLVYYTGRSGESQLTWLDRTGKAVGTVGPQAAQWGVSLSPDGNKVAITRRAPNDTEAAWVHDLVSGAATRLTPPGSPGGGGLWSRDSRTIWFGMTPLEGPARYQRDFASGQLERFERIDPSAGSPTDRSAEGRFVIYTVIDPKTRSDIWYAPVESGRIDQKSAVKLVGTDAGDSQGQLSPDGKWLAYVTAESGSFEVWVRPFPTGARLWKASHRRAEEPRWRADGKELYFKSSTPATGEITIWAASIESIGSAELRIGTPQKVLDARASTQIMQSNFWTYSPHPDGQRFLINALTETSEPTVNVITNWQQAVAANAQR